MLAMVPKRLHSLPLACLTFAMVSGCSKSTPPATTTAAPVPAVNAGQQARQAAIQAIDQIPPPAKSRYLAVHTQESWSNPFLIVGRQTVHLRVILPDVNPSSYGTGTMLRPSDARKQDLDLRIDDLPDALSAVPAGAWPYGRVVAVEEAPVLTKADRPQVRRNVETTIQVLNDLGIVVDEWTGPNGSLLR
jgi:hypothetical protein